MEIYPENIVSIRLSTVDQRQMYNRYAGALYGLIRKLSPEQAVADSLFIECFTKIYKDAGEYEASKGSKFAWMVRLTIRQCTQRLNLSERTVRQCLKCASTAGYVRK